MLKIPPQYYSALKFFCFLIRASGNLLLLAMNSDPLCSKRLKPLLVLGQAGNSGSGPADISPGAPCCSSPSALRSPRGSGAWLESCFYIQLDPNSHC